MIFTKTDALWIGRFDKLLNDPRVIHGFSTRKGGVSAPPFDTLNLGRNTTDSPICVDENRRRFLGILGLTENRIVMPKQVHGRHIAVVTEPGELPETDAVITCRTQLPLSIQVADCVPVFLFDPVVPCIGLVHAGWRGTVSEIAAGTVRALAHEYGSAPGNIIAFIGPSIGPCCYETGEEVRARFDLKYVQGKTLDLQLCNQDQLVSEGLRIENIQRSGICTRCNSGFFFSHRAGGGTTGRMMAVLMLK